MLTRLVIRNFKTFSDVDIELGDRVVFVGPNNSGKTTALQALALWNAGVRRWVEKRGAGEVSMMRTGVTINRRDLIPLPVPSANLLWRNLHVREGVRMGDKTGTKNILVDIEVEGTAEGEVWRTAMEFDYANEESFYCRSKVADDGARGAVPAAAAKVKLAYLPPMSGLAANETLLPEGAVAVRIGEGRTAEVLRNLCWQAFQHSDKTHWTSITGHMQALFGIELADPVHVPERGELTMEFRSGGVDLDLSASGRGQQQMLLLLAHMAANPGSVLLLDEPDAHLEILRQRQMYDVLTAMAAKTKSQIIAASHSEVLLNEAADRDIVVAFIGKPHRIDDRGTAQVAKALKEIGFEQYLQAEQTGWVLYLEGSTDLAILRAFAATVDHPAKRHLERPFVHYVGNKPTVAQAHFHGLREAKADLVGIAIFDRLARQLPTEPYLRQETWSRYEIENYLTSREALVAFARDYAVRESTTPLFADSTVKRMEAAIEVVVEALRNLGKEDPFGPDLKVSTEFLDPVFKTFFTSIGLPEATMRKTDYHTLAGLVPRAAIPPEITTMLDAIHAVAERAIPRT